MTDLARLRELALAATPGPASADRFRSNYGQGQWQARILCVADDFVMMERWQRTNGPRTKFTLSLWYLLSESCGWRLVAGEGVRST